MNIKIELLSEILCGTQGRPGRYADLDRLTSTRPAGFDRDESPSCRVVCRGRGPELVEGDGYGHGRGSYGADVGEE